MYNDGVLVSPEVDMKCPVLDSAEEKVLAPLRKPHRVSVGTEKWFPKMVVPQNGWVLRKMPKNRIDDLEVPLIR